LNTNELAKVVKVNKNTPLQPMVNVIFDPDGHKLPEPKPIELFKHPTIYIKRALEDKDLPA